MCLKNKLLCIGVSHRQVLISWSVMSGPLYPIWCVYYRRKAKLMVNGVVEDAGGATSLPVFSSFNLPVLILNIKYI